MNTAIIDTERYRTARKRIWAAIVDGIVFIPLLLVSNYLVYPTSNYTLIIAWQVFSVFAPIAYSIIAHYKYGQTIGKWVAGIKVLDKSENSLITLRQSLIRDSFYLLIEMAGFIYYLRLAATADDYAYLINGIDAFSSAPFFIWTLLELITMLTNEKRRAIHDFLANSVVVRTN